MNDWFYIGLGLASSASQYSRSPRPQYKDNDASAEYVKRLTNHERYDELSKLYDKDIEAFKKILGHELPPASKYHTQRRGSPQQLAITEIAMREGWINFFGFNPLPKDPVYRKLTGMRPGYGLGGQEELICDGPMHRIMKDEEYKKFEEWLEKDTWTQVIMGVTVGVIMLFLLGFFHG